MAANEREVSATLSRMDAEINALPAGPARQAVRTSYEDLIVLLADAGYDLRRGYNLPAA